MSTETLLDRTHTTDALPDTDSPFLVYDESIPGAKKITGSSVINEFEGDIASFTYNNAALLPDGTKGKVVITYKNLSMSMQSNFGKAGKALYEEPDTRMVGNLKAGKKFSDFWGYDLENERGSIFTSSSSKGGTIVTTKLGNQSGDLNDGSGVISSGKYDIADGKNVIYNMVPDDHYSILSVTVDGNLLTLPDEGETTYITLTGPTGEEQMGELLNISDGKYIFLFPNNNYDHEIDVVWKANDFPITYDLDGGNNHEDNPDSYTIEDDITIKDPTKEGYTFLGWEEGNKISLGSTGAKHFTAKWKKIEENPNPPTRDNIIFDLSILLISVVCMVGVMLYNKKINV